MGPQLLFVNDLPDWIKKTDIRMFADDTKFWTRISGIRDTESLQRDLGSLSFWSDKWLLRFNPYKCRVMHIRQYRHSHRTSYTIRQDPKAYPLQEATEKKDMGVLTKSTADIKTSRKCSEAASKASRILGMVTG